MLDKRPIDLVNVKKTFFGYNQKQADDRMRMINIDYNKLYDEYIELIERNKLLEEGLVEKNLECFELQKKVDNLEFQMKDLNISQVKLKEQIKQEQNKQKENIKPEPVEIKPAYEEPIKKSKLTLKKDKVDIDEDEVLIGEVEIPSQYMMLGDGSEDEDEGLVFIN